MTLPLPDQYVGGQAAGVIKELADIQQRLDGIQMNFEAIAKTFPLNSSHLSDGTVGTTQLANDAVTTAKILNDNVTSAKLADGAATREKTDHDGLHLEGSSTEAGVSVAQGAQTTILSSTYVAPRTGYYHLVAQTIALPNTALATALRCDFPVVLGTADLDGRTTRVGIAHSTTGATDGVVWRSVSVDTWFRLNGGTSYTVTFSCLPQPAGSGTGAGWQFWNGRTYTFLTLD